LREDIKVSFELSFGFLEGKEPAGMPFGRLRTSRCYELKQKSPGETGAQFFTALVCQTRYPIVKSNVGYKKHRTNGVGYPGKIKDPRCSPDSWATG
jgi:hypothetical protein